MVGKQLPLRVGLAVLVAVFLFFNLVGESKARPDRVKVLISFAGPLTASDEGPIQKAGGKVRYRYHHIPVISAEVPETAIEGLQRSPRVRFVERDGRAYAIAETLPWGVDRIDGEIVHSYNKGTGIKVAIIDTGIDLDHPDLDVAGDVTFVSGTTSGNDDHGHGTHVAGTVAALDNDFGVIGVAPEAELYAVKVLDRNGSGYWSDVIAGIDWSIDHGMQVINMSLGGSSGISSLEMAVNNAYESGILVVAAAGNNGNSWGWGDNVLYPAKYGSVMAVAATDTSDDRAYFSSTGPDVEIAAPGSGIFSTGLGGGYTTKSGTSMASPHLAGVGAVVLASGIPDSNGDGRVNDEVRSRLQQTARDLGPAGRDDWYGYGLVDAVEAIALLNEIPTAPTVGISPNLPVTTEDLVAAITTPSSDPDGDPITYSYAWYKDDVLQPGFIGGTIPATSTTRGEVWRCLVTPSDGSTDGPPGQDQVTIRNSPPEADAGVDRTAFIAMLTVLDGGGSTDADGDALSYAWTQTGGPAIALSDPATPGPSFTPLVVDTYTFRLVVSDAQSDSSPDESTVTVLEENTPPEISSGTVDPASGSITTAFRYRVTYTDVDNNPPGSVEMAIDGGTPRPMAVRPGEDGDFANGEVFELTVPGLDLGVGNHDFQFSADDGWDVATGDTGAHSGPTVANHPPTAPEIDVTPDFPVTTEDLVASITTPSSDPDGDPVTYSYAWYKDDVLQPGFIDDTIPATSTAKGEVWRCLVTPNDGSTDGPPGQGQVTIRNSPPEADAGVDRTAFIAMLTVLDGGGSTDADGDVLSYAWTQTGGPAIALSDPATPGPSFTPLVVGTYTFRLVVSDAQSDSSPDEVAVTVASPTMAMHVESVDALLVERFGGWRTYATAAVTILDASGNPVGGLQVEGHWEGATTGAESGGTNGDGRITFTSDYRRRPAGGTKYTFIIDNLTKQGWKWDRDNSIGSGSVPVP